MTISKDLAERLELTERVVRAKDQRDAALVELKRAQRTLRFCAVLFLALAAIDGAHLMGWL